MVVNIELPTELFITILVVVALVEVAGELTPIMVEQVELLVKVIPVELAQATLVQVAEEKGLLVQTQCKLVLALMEVLGQPQETQVMELAEVVAVVVAQETMLEVLDLLELELVVVTLVMEALLLPIEEEEVAELALDHMLLGMVVLAVLELLYYAINIKEVKWDTGLK